MRKRDLPQRWLIMLGAVGALLILALGLSRARPSLPPDELGAAAPAEEDVARAPVSSEPLTLLGQLRLTRSDDVADVAAYQDLALVGSYCGASGGAHIVDISQPEKPVKLAESPPHVNTSAEDLQALRLGERDVLALGLQNCARRSQAVPHRGDPMAQGLTGLELVDISDPRRPEPLSFFATAGGVHEFDLLQHADGRALALLALPRLEARTADPVGQGGTGDLVIVDISDPLSPTLVSEWGLLGAPELGQQVFDEALRGQLPDTLLHSVRASENGRLAYLSYWDAGVIILDLADPASPRFVSRIGYGPAEEGNAHSVAEAADGRTLVVADEDFSPYDLYLESDALDVRAGAFGVGVTSEPEVFRDRPLRGTLVDAGLLCEEDDASLTGVIALVEAGECGFGTKIALAQKAGAKGVVIFSAEQRPGLPAAEVVADIDDDLEVELPGGGQLRLMIPALFIQRAPGLQLRAQGEPVVVKSAVSFGGYGYLRLFDISDPAQPAALGSFATPNSRSEEHAARGWWTVHNPEVVGDTVFASWYHDGVWAVDISDPSSPAPLASWDGAGRLVFIWGVVPHGELLLVSDMSFGLYVFKA